jgi:hypothetical protein
MVSYFPIGPPMPEPWGGGGFTNDVSALPTLGGVVRSVDSAANAFSPGMVRAY